MKIKLEVANDTFDPEELYLLCQHCESMHYYVVVRDGFNWLHCMQCGTNLTNEIFGN